MYRNSENVSREYPILVVARQQKGVLSWQIPLLVDTKSGDVEFYNTSRTLCPDSVNLLSTMSSGKMFCLDVTKQSLK